MLGFWFGVLSQSISRSIETIGQTKAGLVWGLATALIGLGLVRYAHSDRDLREYVGRFLVEVVAVGFIAWMPIFLFYVAKIPYEQFQTERSRGDAAVADSSSLEQRLQQKIHYLQQSDPAFQNMIGVVRAFMAYRRAIGADAKCWLLITAPRDDAELAGIFIQLGVLGANCPNGDLQNIGVKPEYAEQESVKGMVPGTIVVHALPDTPGALQLVDDLSNIVQVTRSFTMPGNPNGHVIWLQFGPGVKWNSQRP